MSQRRGEDRITQASTPSTQIQKRQIEDALIENLPIEKINARRPRPTSGSNDECRRVAAKNVDANDPSYLCTALSLSGPDSRRRLAVCRILCLSRRCRRLRTDMFRISAARV